MPRPPNSTEFRRAEAYSAQQDDPYMKDALHIWDALRHHRQATQETIARQMRRKHHFRQEWRETFNTWKTATDPQAKARADTELKGIREGYQDAKAIHRREIEKRDRLIHIERATKQLFTDRQQTLRQCPCYTPESSTKP